MLTLTPAAAREIQAAALRSGLPEDDWALRIAADVDAEGAIRFGLGFDEEREADLSFTDHGVALLVGAPSQELLSGVTLDFSPQGFVFLPPQESPEDLVAPASNVSRGSGSCGGGGCPSCSGTSGCG